LVKPRHDVGSYVPIAGGYFRFRLRI
jgi:hypothetical protein